MSADPRGPRVAVLATLFIAFGVVGIFDMPAQEATASTTRDAVEAFRRLPPDPRVDRFDPMSPPRCNPINADGRHLSRWMAHSPDGKPWRLICIYT